MVYDALRTLLGPRPSLRQALEVRWTLLLIISKMRALGQPATTDKYTWMEDIYEIAETEEGLRQQTGVMIANFFDNASWGLQKLPNASSCNTVSSVNAIHAGVVLFTRQLAAELKLVEDQGLVLKDYDVEEASVEEDDTEEDETSAATTPQSNRKSRPRQGKAVASESSTKPRSRPSQSTVGHGNHAHGRAMPWTTAEYIGLLELYRDNPDRKLVSHSQIAILHNARFWPKLGEGRTSASVSQQYLKLVRHDVALVPAKLTELRRLLDTQQ